MYLEFYQSRVRAGIFTFTFLDGWGANTLPCTTKRKFSHIIIYFWISDKKHFVYICGIKTQIYFFKAPTSKKCLFYQFITSIFFLVWQEALRHAFLAFSQRSFMCFSLHTFCFWAFTSLFIFLDQFVCNFVYKQFEMFENVNCTVISKGYAMAHVYGCLQMVTSGSS